MILVETGWGVRGANSYVSANYVNSYLTLRNSETDWIALSEQEQTAAIIAATVYLEHRYSSRFQGYQDLTFKEKKATGTIVFNGTGSPGDVVRVGGREFILGTDSLVGATATETASNLQAAINGSVSATAEGRTVTLTAKAPGAGGNLTELSVTSEDATVSGPTLDGGADGGAHSLSWPRRGVYDSAGREVEGVPEKIRMATAEYARRAAVDDLAPDPEVSPSGGTIVESEETVGPITEKFVYESGTAGRFTFRPYPTADFLVESFVNSRNRVIRA